jgi:CII-binding regulator of phage lambda lysogenization HflD
MALMVRVWLFGMQMGSLFSQLANIYNDVMMHLKRNYGPARKA